MTPEMQVINHLLYWTIFTGFGTGLFLSRFPIQIIELTEKYWRLNRFKKYRKKLAERVSTSDSRFRFYDHLLLDYKLPFKLDR